MGWSESAGRKERRERAAEGGDDEMAAFMSCWTLRRRNAAYLSLAMIALTTVMLVFSTAMVMAQTTDTAPASAYARQDSSPSTFVGGSGSDEISDCGWPHPFDLESALANSIDEVIGCSMQAQPFGTSTRPRTKRHTNTLKEFVRSYTTVTTALYEEISATHSMIRARICTHIHK